MLCDNPVFIFYIHDDSSQKILEGTFSSLSTFPMHKIYTVLNSQCNQYNYIERQTGNGSMFPNLILELCECS